MANRTILLSAENGPILAADDTGLVLRLSDRVVADLARRLAALRAAEPAPSAPPAPAPAMPLDAAILGDIDGWDVTRQGDWLAFTARLPGAEGARQRAHPGLMGFHSPQDVVEHPQGAEAPRAPGRPGSAALEVWCQRLKPRRKRFELRR